MHSNFDAYMLIHNSCIVNFGAFAFMHFLVFDGSLVCIHMMHACIMTLLVCIIEFTLHSFRLVQIIKCILDNLQRLNTCVNNGKLLPWMNIELICFKIFTTDGSIGGWGGAPPSNPVSVPASPWIMFHGVMIIFIWYNIGSRLYFANTVRI